MFRPEFLNRVDSVVVFRPLEREQIRAIAEGLLEKVRQRLAARDIALDASPEALDALAEQGYDPLYGARPLRRCVRRLVEDPLAEMLLTGALHAGDRAALRVHDGQVTVERAGG